MPYVDCNVMRMVPDAPLSQAHSVFKQLGHQHVFLVGCAGYSSSQVVSGRRRDVLVGMLSKKAFINYLQAGHVGHRASASESHWSSSARTLEFSTRWARRPFTGSQEDLG